jgi:GNAT superfamily N-acetyltransferase
VGRLEAHPQLVSFARTPEREKQLLVQIAGDIQSNLSLAHTPEGVIVAQVSIVPAEGRWADVPEVYEAGIEVVQEWRPAGIGPQLLKFAFERETIEQMIVLALGLSWHWDLDGEGLNVWAYREMIARLFGSVGFREERTDDPEITYGEGNILLVRTGKNVDHEAYDEFHSRLFGRTGWFGLS